MKLTTTELQRIIQEELDELDEGFWDEFKKSSGVEKWPDQAGKWAGKKLKKAKQTVTGEPLDAEPFDDPTKDRVMGGITPGSSVARMAGRRKQKDAIRRGRNVYGTKDSAKLRPFDDPRKDPIHPNIGDPNEPMRDRADPDAWFPRSAQAWRSSLDAPARLAGRLKQKDAERRGRNVGTGIHRDRTLRAKQLEEEDNS